MIGMKAYTFHIDPGHAWLEVPYEEIVLFGLEDKISSYSRQTFDTCFLEEDCDAPLFITAYHSKYQTLINLEEQIYHNDCFVRNLMKYNCANRV